MRRLTIKDIAKIAGVSYATVSRALSGSSEISESTRQRIIEICQREGYRPNSLARSLIRNKSDVIGLIAPDITNPFYSEIAFNIEMYAYTQGYNVMLCNSMHDDSRIEELFEFLVSHQVDGIILASSRNDAGNFAARYFKTIPTILLGDAAVGTLAELGSVNAVSTDNHAGGRIGAQHLLDLGHEKIAYVGMRANSITHQHRVQGFCDVMKKNDKQIRIIENTWSSSCIEHGYALGKELFRSKEKFTAIFASTDTMALGVMQAADEAGVSIPGDCSLLGFDNISYSALPKILLTTIDQRKSLLSKESVDLLIKVIEDNDQQGYSKQFVTPSLVERTSCRSLK